ncbi:MAG: alpha/beta fold hydrolase [Bryobacteraceae bacterium]
MTEHGMPSGGEITFGEFHLHPRDRRLWRDHDEVLLTPKAMDVLIHLASRPGEVVTKEQLFESLWPGTFVSDHALTVQIREIRKALGDDPNHPRFIETRHRRGYRFLPGADLPPEPVPAPDLPAPGAHTPIAQPATRYTLSGEVNIAYQMLGEGAIDVVFVMGWVSHLEYFWLEPRFARFLQRLASFSRLILFDKRGTGLSDRVPIHQLPTLELRMDDVRAVMDAVGSKRAVIVGVSEGGPMSALFAASYPEKTLGLVMFGTYAKRIRDESYPWGRSASEHEQFLDLIRHEWGGPVGIDTRAPSLFNDPEFSSWWAAYLRMGASPSAAVALTRMNAEIDVRPVLEAVRVPTLVLHRTGDRCLLVEEGRYVASHIPGARFVEFPGADHLPFVGNQDEILDEIETFVAGIEDRSRSEPVLATVLFSDLFASPPATPLDQERQRRMRETVAREIDFFRGRPMAVDGPGPAPLATFDGPARALRCAASLSRHAARSAMPARFALHTGECDPMESARVTGVAVRVAAGVHSLSEPGEVTASSTVRDLVAGSGIRFAEAGSLDIPDLQRTWRLYRLTHA